MTQPIWTKNYDVNLVVLNPQKRLGLFGLLNLLQDAAWLHAERLGCGYDQMVSKGIFWVLTRQYVTMTDWPVWGDAVTIRTWARPFSGARAPRDFEVLIGDRKIGEATTNWLILNAETRRPMRFDVLANPVACRSEGCLRLEPQKIAARDDLETVTAFCVRASDLDMNGHVNNTRYAQWVLDVMPVEELAGYRVTGYDVNFLAETRLGDEVAIARGPLETADGGTFVRNFQGQRLSDGKAAFTARLTLRPA